MRPVEPTLPPARWTLEQVLDLAELMLLFLSHPKRLGAHIGYLHPGRLVVDRDSDGTPLSMDLVGSPCRMAPPADVHCAPELRAGQFPTVKSDLYLLGVVLYEVTSGRVFPSYGWQAEPLRELRRIPGLTQIMICTLNSSLRRSSASVNALLDAIAVARAEATPHVTSLEAAQINQVGVYPARLRNQDATGIFSSQLMASSRGEHASLLVLADGMGSTEGGALVAERLVREGHRAFVTCIEQEDYLNLYRYADAHARRISIDAILATRSAMKRDAKLANGGSTWVSAFIVGDRVAITWLGDSRAYFLPSGGGMYALTIDHGLVGAAYAAGRMDSSALRENPFRHIIYQAVMSDVDEAQVPEMLEDLSQSVPGHSVLTLSEGDILVLMSDGVSGELDEIEMESLVRSAPSIQQAALALATEAQGKVGSSDNTSVIVARPCFNPHLDLPPFGPVGRLQ